MQAGELLNCISGLPGLWLRRDKLWKHGSILWAAYVCHGEEPQGHQLHGNLSCDPEAGKTQPLVRLAINGWKDGERKLGYGCALDASSDGNSRCAHEAFPDLPQLPSHFPSSKLSLDGGSEKFSSARTEEK